MAGKQAKVLSDEQVTACLRRVAAGRHAPRNTAMILLSVKAGMRAGEIAALTWPMICGADGKVGSIIELENRAAKKGSGRTIPLHPELAKALKALQKETGADNGPVIVSERGGAMRADAVVNWFASLYRELGLNGCSSHSGRRTFITKAARNIHRAGGSLRDVQELAGHRSLAMTQRYIEGDTLAKRKLVALV